MNTFKKYANRKIYSSKKGYVNLTHILDLVKAGESVQVLFHGSGKDVTEEVIRGAIINSSELSTDKLIEMVRGY
ncbi:polyhydroxyalkanoate synthesis regulator DNA-binding domain-containing protein [bacterium]|nr:polyhydroxyalkanoate synthesis regulator DNA-binding domain-containing protein [bacterium]